MNERYSPLLKPQLTGRVADALVLATSEADVVASLAAAVRHRVFVTTRGAGTGNYGQAAPPPSSSAVDLHTPRDTRIRPHPPRPPRLTECLRGARRHSLPAQGSPAGKKKRRRTHGGQPARRVFLC